MLSPPPAPQCSQVPITGCTGLKPRQAQEAVFEPQQVFALLCSSLLHLDLLLRTHKLWLWSPTRKSLTAVTKSSSDAGW